MISSPLLRVMGKFEGVRSGNHDVITAFGGRSFKYLACTILCYQGAQFDRQAGPNRKKQPFCFAGNTMIIDYFSYECSLCMETLIKLGKL